jgi:hypothetical protein
VAHKGKAPVQQTRLPFSGRTKPQPLYYVTNFWNVYRQDPPYYQPQLVGTILDPDLPRAARRCITTLDLYHAITFTGHCVPLAEVVYGRCI